MAVITATEYVEAANALKYHAALMEIPYSPGGHSLLGMDCQGLCEYLLMQCGVSYRDCNLAGSNAHYRACSWTGTLDECRQRFGCIPDGAWLFILRQDGGEPEKYKGDGIGNASHMGVYLGNSEALHASSSRRSVVTTPVRSTGDWNRIGLPKWIRYDGTESPTVPEPVMQDTAVVATPDGNPVKMRAKPSKRHGLYWKIPNGATVRVDGYVESGGKTWAVARYESRKGFIMCEFLTGG